MEGKRGVVCVDCIREFCDGKSKELRPATWFGKPELKESYCDYHWEQRTKHVRFHKLTDEGVEECTI